VILLGLSAFFLGFSNIWFFSQGLPFFREDGDWVFLSRFEWSTLFQCLPAVGGVLGGFVDRPVQVLVFAGLRALVGVEPAPYYLFKASLFGVLSAMSALCLFALTGRKVWGACAGILVACAYGMWSSCLWICDIDVLALLVAALCLRALYALLDEEAPSRHGRWSYVALGLATLALAAIAALPVLTSAT